MSVSDFNRERLKDPGYSSRTVIKLSESVTSLASESSFPVPGSLVLSSSASPTRAAVSYATRASVSFRSVSVRERVISRKAASRVSFAASAARWASISARYWASLESASAAFASAHSFRSRSFSFFKTQSSIWTVAAFSFNSDSFSANASRNFSIRDSPAFATSLCSKVTASSRRWLRRTSVTAVRASTDASVAVLKLAARVADSASSFSLVSPAKPLTSATSNAMEVNNAVAFSLLSLASRADAAAVSHSIANVSSSFV